MNTDDEMKAVLHRYLTRGREALLWKLDGLSEYDIRRPMVDSGTNLLGLVKLEILRVEVGREHRDVAIAKIGEQLGRMTQRREADQIRFGEFQLADGREVEST